MPGLFSALTSGSPATVPQGGGGLLDLILGAQNPVSQFADNRQNVLGAIGAGLASGPTFAQGLANAAQNIPQARQRDYQTSLYKGSVSQTVAYLQKKYPQLAQAVQSGALSPSDAFQQAFQLDNRPPVVMSPGSYLANGTTGTPLNGGQTPGGFYGSDLKSQAWNTVLKGQADPSQRNSDQYRAAWAIVTEPTMTPQGMMTPNVPPQWAPGAAAAPASSPATAQAAPAGYGGGGPSPLAPPSGAPTPTSAALGDMSMIAPPSNAQMGPGVIPGTQPFNESQTRTNFLVDSTIPDVKRLMTSYPALLNTKDQLLGKLGDLGRVAQSPEYKQASDAMNSSIGNILYFASGANLNAGELQRRVQSYMPAVGDDPQTAVNKLDRFANDVMSLANGTKNPDTIKWAAQAVQGIKATEDGILNSAKPAAPQSVPAGTPIWGPDGKQYVMGSDGNPQPVM